MTTFVLITRQADRVRRRLREERIAQGLTQSNVAAICAAAGRSLSQNYIGEIERGSKNPPLSTLLLLCAALRISPCTLFQGIDEPDDELDSEPVSTPAPKHAGSDQIVVEACHACCDR